MPDLIPFSVQRLREGPFHFPPPEPQDPQLLFKALYKLLNYLTVEWCGGDSPAHLGAAFGSESSDLLDQSFDLRIVISNSTLLIKKPKLDEVFAECHVLHPFLEVSVTTPSLMICASLSSYIRHYHRLWVTPRGVLAHEQSLLSREISNSSILFINFHFKYDIQMYEIKDLMRYYLLRLNIGCRENLMIDRKFDQGRYFLNPRYPKSGNSDPCCSSGAVFVKVCQKCQSCRIQSTKPREITIEDFKFKVRICTRRCFGSDGGACTDARFKGKLTILGPSSIPVLYQSDTDFYNQFNRLVQKWPCMSDNLTHLILIFECPISRKNVHQIMKLLHDTCFQIFSKYQSSFKSSVTQLLNKSAGSSGTTVDLVTASKNLARGISEIVELSQNEDFKKTVKELLPYDTMEALQESILNKSRQFGLKEPRMADTDSGVEPCLKKRKLKQVPPPPVIQVQDPVLEIPDGEFSIDGFSFVPAESGSSGKEPLKRSEIPQTELDDFESLQ